MKWKVKVYIYATQFICLNSLCCFLLTLNHMQPVCQYIVTQGRTTTYGTYVARLNTYLAPLLTQSAFRSWVKQQQELHHQKLYFHIFASFFSNQLSYLLSQ